MQRNRAPLSQEFFDRPKPTMRLCEAPGCACEAEHRAPKARDRLNEYHWFCLEHVREYNKAWDYYAGMSQTEIEAELRRDTTWQRPSWPLGHWAVQERFLRDRGNGFGFAFGRGAGGSAAEDKARRREAARTPEEDALIVLDLKAPVDFPRIKARYRELVKVHHPDANGGDAAAEEKLKQINQAYNTLKACYGS